MKNITDEVALKAQKYFRMVKPTDVVAKSRTVGITFKSYVGNVENLQYLVSKIESFVRDLGWDHDIWLSGTGLYVQFTAPKDLQLPNIIVQKNTKEEIEIHYWGIRRNWLHSQRLGVDIDAQKEDSKLYSGLTKITITPVENFKEWGKEDGFETLDEYLDAIEDNFMSRLSDFGSIFNPDRGGRGYFRVS